MSRMLPVHVGLLVFCLSTGSYGASPVPSTAASAAAVEMPVGPAHLTTSTRVVIRASPADPLPLRQALEKVLRSIAPAAPTTLTTHLGGPMQVLLHWTTPRSRAWVRRLESPSVALPDLEPGVHEFYVVWRDPVLGFELRIPESPRAFRVEVDTSSKAPEIVDGSGTIQGVFGETVPVWVKVRQSSSLRSATIHSRSSPQETATTQPMTLEVDADGAGTFRGKIPRPAGADATVEYWIVLEDESGAQPSYGSATSPHRIILKEPTSEQ